MTKRPPSSNINGIRLLQAWVMSLMLVRTEAGRQSHSNADRFCWNRPDGSFDFYYFVQQWPGSFCSRGCCFDDRNLPASQFNIHGLWPTHIGDKSPCFCSKAHILNYGKIALELNQEMFENWVSLSCPTPKHAGLWKHEWDKHGSCSGLDRHTYFQTAIALHSTYNLLDALYVARIEPDGKMYDLYNVLKALTIYIGERPLISCSFNDEYQVYQIYEVFMCLDKYLMLPIPCPNVATFKSGCPTPRALFPVFDPSSHRPSCQVNPHSPGRRVGYCQDPALVSSHEKEESFLPGNKTAGVLELDEVDLEFLIENKTSGVLELDEVDSEEQVFLIEDKTSDVLELDEEEIVPNFTLRFPNSFVV